MADINSNVKTVIQVLHDGHEGLAKIGEHLKDAAAKTFFLEESGNRHRFEQELKRAAAVTEDLGGTTSGNVHRVWGDIKAHLGGGDHTLLETAEQGEDAAKKAYVDALGDNSVTGTLREILIRQQSHIVASHDRVKALRDSKAA